MIVTTINKVKQGEFLKLSEDSSVVYVRNHYDRATNSFSISRADDINRESFVKSHRVVYIGFTY